MFRVDGLRCLRRMVWNYGADEFAGNGFIGGDVV